MNFIKNPKKGASVIISGVMLVVIVSALSMFIYTWLKNNTLSLLEESQKQTIPKDCNSIKISTKNIKHVINLSNQLSITYFNTSFLYNKSYDIDTYNLNISSSEDLNFNITLNITPSLN